MNIFQVTKSIFLLLILSVLFSCSSTDGGSTSTIGTTAQNGRVSLLITDAPSPVFDQINITLESVSFLSDGDNANEVVIFDESKVINLLALQNYSDLLVTTSVPAGSYSKIRLQVSKVELVKLDPVDGSVLSTEIAKLPSGKIDLNPQESFVVTGGGYLMIELDMDANKSIHVVATGNDKYIFRPVIFVNILGEEELKLVILDGKVLAKSDEGFQLCDAAATEVTDSCSEVRFSAYTIVQNDLIEEVTSDAIEDNDMVTVLGKASAAYINALDIVIASDDPQIQNLALFTGAATSTVDINEQFGMQTDDDNNVVLPGTSLAVTLASSARIFDKYGNVVASDVINSNANVDVFGLAIPDIANVTDITAAFVIYDEGDTSKNISGTIADIFGSESKITVTVNNGVTTVNECAVIDNALMLSLAIVGDDIVQQEITINDLNIGDIVDVYSDGVIDGDGCVSADLVLVTVN